MPTSRSFFIIGCGSIGQRHIGNLLALGEKEIVAFDILAERRNQVKTKFQISTVDSVEEGWQRNPDVAFVTVPTSLHIPVSLEAASHGCHLFIEKPLGDSLRDIDKLTATIKEKGLTTLVGCNMRFHHGPVTIKKLLDQGAVGRIITALIDVGQYLPDWHPREDYRQLYSSNASLGGGVVLDGIHEIDYARWIFGEVEEVYAQGGKLSSLETDTEDTVNILMKMVAGFSVSIHMDYIQRTYSRTCKVIGEEGTITWDMTQGDVRIFSAETKQWTHISPPEGYDVNQMYLDETRHFLECLENQSPTVLEVDEAKRVLEVTLAIKESMLGGEMRRVAA